MFILTSSGHLSCKSKLLILVTTSEQAEALLKLSLSICSFFPFYFKTQYNAIFFSSSVSGPFISPVLVFIWCLGELIWLIKPAYHCVFLCSDYFLLLGWLGFFSLMSYIGSLLAHIMLELTQGEDSGESEQDHSFTAVIC